MIPAALNPVERRGARVTLRELREDDLDPIAEYAADEEVMRYVVFGRTFNIDEERDWLANMMRAASSAVRDDYTLAISADGVLVGTAHIGIESRDHARGFLGYALRRSYWGRGFATEAAQLLVRLGLSDLKLHRIYASVHPRNTASIRVLEKAGLSYEGHARAMFRATDGWRDSLVYAIIESDLEGS